MARRKINIQRSLGKRGTSTEQPGTKETIDKLAGTMSSVDVGFRPTDQRIYEINLDRVKPDHLQPRRILPYDLRMSLQNGSLTAAEVIQELLLRAEEGDTLALLILGGQDKVSVEGESEEVEDTGLLALAHSIREVGLRQPLNVYRIDDPHQPDQTSYRIGEGERRYWAHHLLVLQGHEEFERVRCVVEKLPDDEEIIHQRQEAENAARVDLPAIARARSIKRMMERLNIEMGTRVPGESTLKLPSQRELQIAVGQQVKRFTGRAISDRMVRNYLKLLQLSPEAKDLAEAGKLTEKQLRPVMRLKSDEEQLNMIQQIVEESWSSRRVREEVAASKSSPRPKSTLREVSERSVERRFEKRILDAAKTAYSLLSLPPENYEEAISVLAARAKDEKTNKALRKLYQSLEEILLKAEDLNEIPVAEIPLLSIIPPLEGLKRHLPVDKFEIIETDVLTGSQILDRLIEWSQNDAIIASRLKPFFDQIEAEAEAVRADEPRPLPSLKGEKNPDYPDMAVYEIETGNSIYWAYELLVRQGEEQFRMMEAEIVSITMIDEG